MITKFKKVHGIFLVPDPDGDVHFESGTVVKDHTYPIRGYLKKVEVPTESGKVSIYGFVRIYHFHNVVNSVGSVEAISNPDYYKPSLTVDGELHIIQTRVK